MGKKDPRVDAYIERSAPFARPILAHIRKVVHAGCPDVEEAMKWSAPHFMYKGMLCGMASFKEHCAFGFWKASLVKDSGNGATADGMGQFGRITSLADLPPAKKLEGLVRKAAALNDEGVKAPPRRKTAPRPALRTPPDLQKALGANRKALAAFQAFSPSHRREYIEWITDAKGQETRQRRLAAALEWIAEGKSRNWKYERKSATPRRPAE
jgi:uncharacterized protein YdeI (YjbR/CyaY-like superfamily)